MNAYTKRPFAVPVVQSWRRRSALNIGCQRADAVSARGALSERRRKTSLATISGRRILELMPQKCGASAGMLVVLSASLGMVSISTQF